MRPLELLRGREVRHHAAEHRHCCVHDGGHNRNPCRGDGSGATLVPVSEGASAKDAHLPARWNHPTDVPRFGVGSAGLSHRLFDIECNSGLRAGTLFFDRHLHDDGHPGAE